MLTKERYTKFAGFLLCAILGVFFFAVNFRWLSVYRFDQLLDIDESGYIASAIAYARALEGGGLIGWMHALASPTAQAPVTSMLASILMALFGNSENIALLTNSVIEGLLFVVVFLLGRKLSGAPAGLFGALLVATTPIIVNYARNFQFAMATALFFTLALLFFFHSSAFRNRWASLAVGASLALMILSRTMSIAFLPAFALVFAFDVFVRHKATRQQLINIGLAIAVFLVVACPWYVLNCKIVFGYLFSFGYGAHASEYGSDVGIFTLANLTDRLGILLNGLRPIHFFIIVAAILVYLFSAAPKAREIYKDDRKYFLFSGLMLCFACLFILATSRNRGSGFEIPILPALILFPVCGMLETLKKYRYANKAVYFLSAIACSFVFASEVDLAACGLLPRSADFPLIGPQVVFDCRGTIHQSIDGSGVIAEGAAKLKAAPSLSLDEIKGWRRLSLDIANQIKDLDASRHLVVYASRHFLFNVNTVSLEQIKHFGEIWPAAQIDPNVMDNSKTGYIDWLSSKPLRTACIVVLLTNSAGEFQPHADLAQMRDALTEENYAVVYQTPTPWPDQSATLWRKQDPGCF